MLRSFSLAVLVVLFFSSPTKSAAQTETKSEQYSATALLTGISAPSSSQNTIPLDFFIYSYTPEDELQSLVHTFNTEGEPGIEKAFSKMKERGRMSTNLRLSQGSLKYIRSSTSGDETVIRLVTDRILSFQERIDNSALSKYQFSVIELHLDSHGKGQGTLTYAAKLKFTSQGELELESYPAIPIQLGNVRKLK